MKRLKKSLKKLFVKSVPVNWYLYYCEQRNQNNEFGFSNINPHIFLNLLANNYKNCYFIQIGANDGVNNDPIHDFIKKYGWKGVLVEPLPLYFEQLRNNYAGFEENLKFENLGISEEEGELSFYYLPKELNEPSWFQQIGSFDEAAVKFNLAAHPEAIELIIKKKISTISLQDLITKNKVEKIDLLVIDVEGYEYKILRQLEDLSLSPQFILFEWGCLSKEDLKSLIVLLKKMNYSMFKAGGDFLAVKNYRKRNNGSFL